MVKLLNNKLDEIIDKILDNFYEFIKKRKLIQKINQDENFVTFQNIIIDNIKEYYQSKDKEKENLGLIMKEVKNLMNDDKKNRLDSNQNLKILEDYILKYITYYLFLVIAYFYNSGRDLYTTNIIEISKNQKNNVFKIENFFNSETNSNLVSMFNIIKNFLNAYKLGSTIDKIKIILNNNPIKFESTIKYFNKIGEEFIIKKLLIKENSHNLVKSLIINEIYLNEDKDQILKNISTDQESLLKYKFIEIVRSKDTKLIDFMLLQKYLSVKQINSGLASEIYNYLEEMKIKKELSVKTNKQIVDFLFTTGILIPITEDFMRYHKDSEKYTIQSMIDETSNIVSMKEDTKIKLLLNKINKIKNFYSKFNENNQKIKNETEKLFFQQMIEKLPIIYNESEELKIIQKLEDSEKDSDLDMLVELDNIRNYSYINFKDFSKDGFNFRPTETVKCIRYANILYQQKKPDQIIEYRIGNDTIDINIVGVAWNPSLSNLDYFVKKDLINVNEITESASENKEKNIYNNYKSFESVMNETFKNPRKKLFYWLFNAKDDNSNVSQYVNVDSLEKNQKIMNDVKEIFFLYSDLLQDKIKKEIKKFPELSIYDINNIINYYSYKFFDFSFDEKLSSDIYNFGITNKIVEKKIEEDKIDSFIPGKSGDIVRLPAITDDEIDKYTNFKKRKNILLVTDKVEEDISIEEEKYRPICYHHYKVRELAKEAKSRSEDFNQSVFNFVKQYVKTNEKGDYICRSCEEYLDLKKYQTTGTYVKELDVFMTTSLGVREDLWKIPKYSKFSRGIRNIEKNLEKLCFSINLNAYLGGTPIERLRRKTVIKDIVDMILIHTEFLKEEPKNRIEIAGEKYGINLSNLFFFKFEDDIFLTSSKDTDKFKKIKFNNVLSYMILILISEMNVGQIMGLKTDKRCNYLVYKNVKENLFRNVKLKLAQDKIEPILNYPVLTYILFYFSCVFTSNYIWLWDYENDKGFNTTIQITIINTVIDLFNSIIEANFKIKEKSFQYEIISNRLIDKISRLYKDEDIINSIEKQFNTKIKIDKDTKKISFVTKKIKMISLEDNPKDSKDSMESNQFITKKDELETKLINISQTCETVTKRLSIGKEIKDSIINIPNEMTNCEDGQFHSWKYLKIDKSSRFSKIDLKCQKCNKKYSDVIKLIKPNNSQELIKQYEKILKQMKINNLSKLAKEHCLDGQFHEFEEEGSKCSKCKIDIDKYNYTIDDYYKLEENLKKINDINVQKTIEDTKKLDTKIKNNFQKKLLILNKFKERYESYSKSNIIKYVDDFVIRLQSILGKSIKLGNQEIFLNSTYFIIDHDNYGNQTKNEIIIFDKENKIIYEEKNKYFGKDIYFMKDTKKNMKVYYDAINLNYLGYSDYNSNKITEIKTYSKLNIISSIRDKLLNLGLPDFYFNLNLINESFDIENSKQEQTKKIREIMQKIIIFRSQNIKEIINKFIRTIFSVKNRKKEFSIYSQKEIKITNDSINNIKKFETRNEDNSKSIFKHWKYITNYPMDSVTTNIENYNILTNLGFDFINSDSLFTLNNLDSKMLFFLIYNLNRLLDYNNSSQQINQNLSFMIIKLINYNFDFYRIPFDNLNLRKFYKAININAPNIDESLRVIGSYEELLNSQEIDDQNKGLITNEEPEKTEEDKNREEDAREEKDSLDIDDYENEDNEDGYGEEETGYMDFL